MYQSHMSPTGWTKKGIIAKILPSGMAFARTWVTQLFFFPCGQIACHLLSTFILPCMGLCGPCWLSSLNLQKNPFRNTFHYEYCWEKTCKLNLTMSHSHFNSLLFLLYKWFILSWEKNYMLKSYWLYLCHLFIIMYSILIRKHISY